MIKLEFNFFEDFIEVCKGFKTTFNEKNLTYRGLPIKDCMNAVYEPNNNIINVNLTAFRNDIDIINSISRSIQHEHLHYCVMQSLKIRTHSIKAEEIIVCSILNYDYPLEVFDNKQ